MATDGESVPKRTVALGTKIRPSQERSHETFELILRTAGELLETIGFEQLSTNLVCKQAGLTPPALYRYFPNKYAILKELGDRLMAAQDEIPVGWLEARPERSHGADVETRVRNAVAIQMRVLEATRAFPGGVAITRALRAVPMLSDVRLKSRDAVADVQAAAYIRAYPDVPADKLVRCSRLCIEMMYSSMEMVLEEPGEDTPELIEGACRAVVLWMQDLQDRHARGEI